MLRFRAILCCNGHVEQFGKIVADMNLLKIKLKY